MCFIVFIALYVILLIFRWWYLAKFLQHIASSRKQDLNTQKSMVCKGSFYNFCICLSYLFKKTGFKDLPGKLALTKIFTTSLPNFM